MGIWQKAVLVCDDVRYEHHNKLTLVGLYTDSIILPPGAGRIALPKLAVVNVIAGLRGRNDLRYRHFVRIEANEASENQNEPKLPDLVDEKHNAATDEHSFVLQMTPVIFPGPCRMHTVFEVKVGDETEHFEYTIRVVRKPLPGAP